MPKPTLIQSVFRKPTRSYADPNFRNPFADYDEEETYYRQSFRSQSSLSLSRPSSRYTSRTDRGVHLGYTEVDNPRYATTSGGSVNRKASKRRSNIPPAGDFDPQPQPVELTAGTRFPKPVKRTPTGASITGTGRKKEPKAISLNERERQAYEDGLVEVTRSGTVKKKKKSVPPPSQPDSSEDESVVSARRTAKTTATPGRKVTQSAPSKLANGIVPKSASGSTSLSKTTPTPSKAVKKQSLSSAQLAPTPTAAGSSRQIQDVSPPPLPKRKSPAKTKVVTVQPNQAPIESAVEPPLTPPISDKSSLHSKRKNGPSTSRPITSPDAAAADATGTIPPPLPSRPNKSPKRRSISEFRDHVGLGVDDQDEDQDVFYTPRTSADPNSARSTMVEPPTSSTLKPSNGDPPTVVFHPPTPAAEDEPDESPFHSEQGSSLSSSLHPNDGQRSEPTPRASKANKRKSTASPTPKSAKIVQVAAPVRLQAEDVEVDGEDAESLVGDVGSEHEPEDNVDVRSFSRASPSKQSKSGSSQSRSGDGASRSRPPSIGRSASSANDLSSRSRATRSVRESKTYDDFVVHQRESYARSESARSLREGSIRSGKSGTSGGYGKGGWAAAAASRSGATTPVSMFMPTGGNDGWADFQQPPPRQSKFTPLPAASQPQTFDKFVLGIPDQQSNYNQVPEAADYPSSYESSEEEEELPRPSRSYARRDVDGSPHSQTPQSSNSGQEIVDERVALAAALESQQGRRGLGINTNTMANNYVNASVAANANVYDMSRVRAQPEMDEESESTEWHEETLQRLHGISSPPPPLPLGLPERSRWPGQSPSASVDDTGMPTRPSARRNMTEPAGSEYSSAVFDPRPQMIHAQTERPMSPSSDYSLGYDDFARPRSRVGFSAPSTLDPDTITLLPEMTAEDSARTYEPSEPVRPPSRRDTNTPNANSLNAAGNAGVNVKRSGSVFSSASKTSKASTDYEDEKMDVLGELPELRRPKSGLSLRNLNRNRDRESDGGDWEGSSNGEGVLMESHGRNGDTLGGYTGLILPAGAYKPGDPTRSVSEINARILGMPHSTMASITLSTLPSRDTPLHLRSQTPPVDFSSFVPPPSKVGSGQLLVQVYATAVDEWDIRALDEKNKGDVHKWIPGRSFVGRCLSVGGDEKDIVRGEIVVGLMDIKKSGALCEYMLCDRRRLARAPYPTSLTLEQLSLLPLLGIPASRIIRTHLIRQSRALIMDPHQGVSALICQEMSRAGVNVTALVSGGEEHHDVQTACMANGARGVLTGSPAAVMLSLDEGGWDFILDTKGGQRVYEAAKRILKNGAKLVTTVKFDPSMPSNQPLHTRSSGLKALRAAFSSRRKDSKYIAFEYLPAGGTGEPEVDGSGMDCRDVLEDAPMVGYRPVVRDVLPLERGVEAFKPRKGVGVTVVRLVN